MSSLRSELAKVYTDNGGELTPDAVVETATPERSPLHTYFEWNNGVAGHKYRLLQAQELIRSVRIVYSETRSGPKTIREYTSTYEAGESKPGVYKRTEEVVRDDISYTTLVRQMEREIASLKRRYGHLVEFAQAIRDAAA